MSYWLVGVDGNAEDVPKQRCWPAALYDTCAVVLGATVQLAGLTGLARTQHPQV
jgi:hypothetical protein